MNKIKYNLHLGETADCTNRMMEETNLLGHRDVKGDSKDCFLFDIWFFSNKLEEAAIYVVADMIVMVRNNKKV